MMASNHEALCVEILGLLVIIGIDHASYTSIGAKDKRDVLSHDGSHTLLLTVKRYRKRSQHERFPIQTETPLLCNSPCLKPEFHRKCQVIPDAE